MIMSVRLAWSLADWVLFFFNHLEYIASFEILLHSRPYSWVHSTPTLLFLFIACLWACIFLVASFWVGVLTFWFSQVWGVSFKINMWCDFAWFLALWWSFLPLFYMQLRQRCALSYLLSLWHYEMFDFFIIVAPVKWVSFKHRYFFQMRMRWLLLTRIPWLPLLQLMKTLSWVAVLRVLSRSVSEAWSSYCFSWKRPCFMSKKPSWFWISRSVLSLFKSAMRWSWTFVRHFARTYYWGFLIIG